MMFRRNKTSGVLTAMMMMAGLAIADPPSLDELLNLEPAAPTKLEKPASSQDVEDEITLDASVQDKLEGRDAPGDAFKQAVLEMDRVAVRLGRAYDSGLETQRMQASILRKLDQVIAQAKKQQSSGSSSSSGSAGGSAKPSNQDHAQGAQAQAGTPGAASADPSSQAGGSTSSDGSAGVGRPTQANLDDPRAMRELRDQWGSLPPRLRDELSQGLNEHFSSVYRVMTQRYYQRLAEEQE